GPMRRNRTNPRSRQSPPPLRRTPRMTRALPAPPRVGPPRNRSSRSSLPRGPCRGNRNRPRPLPRRSPRREPGTAAQARGRQRRTGRRRPALAARSPDRAAQAAQVGADLAAARLRGFVLLVAADLPLPHAAGLRGAPRGREGAALRIVHRAFSHLPEGRPVCRTVRRLALHLLAHLVVRRPGPLLPRAARDRPVRGRSDPLLPGWRRLLLRGHSAADVRFPDQEHGS